MHLTVNEIIYLLKTWNSWYLVSHDENINSEYSDNETAITISPFDVSKITDEIREDLLDYTDDLDLTNPDMFKVSFLFSAKDHQPDQIFKAIRAILEKSIGSTIKIINKMEFIETDLPDESLLHEQMDERIREAINKYKGKKKEEETKAESIETSSEGKEANLYSSEEAGDEKSELQEQITGEPVKIYNELFIRGIIQKDYIEVEELLHNEQELDSPNLLLEAARLYETVDRNFKEPDSREEINPYDCADESEAALVGLYLGTTTEYRPQRIDGKTIYSGAYPEELASIISFVRYKNRFKLFFNPYIERLRLKKKMSKAMAHKIYRQACSCIMFAMMVILFLLLWWIFTGKK